LDDKSSAANKQASIARASTKQQYQSKQQEKEMRMCDNSKSKQ
jgi:ubiquitin